MRASALILWVTVLAASSCGEGGPGDISPQKFDEFPGPFGPLRELSNTRLIEHSGRASEATYSLEYVYERCLEVCRLVHRCRDFDDGTTEACAAECAEDFLGDVGIACAEPYFDALECVFQSECRDGNMDLDDDALRACNLEYRELVSAALPSAPFGRVCERGFNNPD